MGPMSKHLLSLATLPETLKKRAYGTPPEYLITQHTPDSILSGTLVEGSLSRGPWNLAPHAGSDGAKSTPLIPLQTRSVFSVPALN